MAEAKLKVYTGQLSRGGLNRPMKMVKMAQPRCDKCNPRGQGKRGWWDRCPHDPYFTVHEELISKPKLEEQADGRVLKVGEETEVEYHREPNFKQIADDPKVASGRMIQIQRERGAKFPEEIGYAPICDFFNCWEPNPKIEATRVFNNEGVQTRVGRYHHRDEAAIITLRLNQTPVYAGVDRDIERRRAQLDAVNIV